MEGEEVMSFLWLCENIEDADADVADAVAGVVVIIVVVVGNGRITVEIVFVVVWSNDDLVDTNLLNIIVLWYR